MRRDKMNIIVLLVCTAAVALASVFIGYSFGSASTAASAPTTASVPLQIVPSVSTPAPAQETPQTATRGATEGYISIPGFERLTANGQTLHAAVVSNSAGNGCYFVVSFILPDGSEVYRSSYLAPGQSLGDVELSTPLAAGTYPGVTARYSCYAIDDMRQLNGADIAFTLEVLP